MNRKAILVFLIIVTTALLLAVDASAEEATNADLAAEFPGMFIDATGQWKYELEGGEAIITGSVEEEPTGDLVIPGELDGYPVTVIGVGAFDWGDDLTSITIPAGVTHISRYAFAYASDGLKSITIPEGVTDIDDYAFYWCTGLASVTLPDSLTQIKGNPFSGCPITTLNVSPGNPAYTVINGVLFDKRNNTLVVFPREMQDEYEIPQGTAGIGEAAFEGCDNLTSITIPDSVTEIGDGAFSQCQGLTDLTIPGSVRGIGDFAFWECENLTSVTILDGVTSIGDDVFQNCNNLTCVTIPASVTDIGWAFDGCYDLVLSVQKGSYAEQYAKENDIAYTYANDGNGAKKITYGVRQDGSVIIYKLEPVYINGYEAENSGAFAYILKDGLATIIGFSSYYSRPWDWMYQDWTESDIVGYSDSLESAKDLYEPGRHDKGAESVDDGSGGVVWVDENDRGKGFTLVIPDRIDGFPVVAIYDYAFTETRFLGVTLPEGLISIGEGAFGICDEFDTIIIPNGVTSIGEWAFANCLRLTDVTIPESVTQIGDEAFVVEEVILRNGLERNLVLRVKAGSFAERYAKDNGIAYITTE